MIIQSDTNTSRSRICQPYAKSATLRNFNANANSRKARVTLNVFIQPPDLGNFFSTDGNMANSENGNANAMAKPNIPIAGARIDLPAASTSKVPMIGPVHENDTITNVNAISRMLRKPVVLLDLLLSAVDHELGKVISNAPKNDAAKTIKIAKKIIFGIQCVANQLKISAVTASPPTKYVIKIITAIGIV